jgi:hypothetical protein
MAAAGWGGAHISPLPGDASFRRYFRVLAGQRAMLMHAPPPQEDPRRSSPRPAGSSQRLRAPHILAEDAQKGWVCWKISATIACATGSISIPGRNAIYRAAIAPLVRWAACLPGLFRLWHGGISARGRPVHRMVLPGARADVDVPGYVAAWEQVLAPLASGSAPA